jgi:hypothetical protein
LHRYLLQESSDIVLAALRPCQWGRIVLELVRHDVRVPAHRLTVIFFPIVLDAKAGTKHKNSKQAGIK